MTDIDLSNGRLAWLVIGLSNSGKTFLVKKLLRDQLIPRFTIKDKNGDKHCNIFIMSPSASLSGDWEEFEDFIPTENKMVQKQRLFDKYDEDVIYELFKSQEAVIKKHGKAKCPEILIVLDDLIEHLQRSKSINALFTRGRHYKIAVILISQKFKSINRTIRVNAAKQTFFRSSNSSEIEHFCEECVGKRYKNQFFETCEQLFKEPYSFVHVDFDEKEFKKRFGLGSDCRIIDYFS